MQNAEMQKKKDSAASDEVKKTLQHPWSLPKTTLTLHTITGKLSFEQMKQK